MKVLIVEDEPLLQRLYGRVLTESNYEVVIINDGSTALATVQQEMPDIILMDVMMPNLNGMDALKILKEDEQTKQIPVIMLSAHEDDKFLIKAMQMGASRYLLKSNVEPQQIVALVNETLGVTPS